MSEENLAAAGIAIVVGAVSGFVAAAIKSQFDRRKTIDESVRAYRVTSYAYLWQITSLLPLWPQDTVHISQVRRMSRALRAWYFGGYPHSNEDEEYGFEPSREQPGGMYLSQESRDVYTTVQDEIKRIVSSAANGTNNGPGGNDPNTAGRDDPEISEIDYEKLRKRCSNLRTELTSDLLSRRRGFLVG